MPVFYAPDFNLVHPTLPPEESKHAAKVLRMEVGDELEVVDGKGHRYSGRITTLSAREVAFSVIESTEEEQRSVHFHLAIAPTKNRDRMEWLVEKAVEMGIERMTFLQADHSERSKVNLDRLNRIAVAAMKQSKRSHLPEIIDITATSKFWPQAKESEKYIAHCLPLQKVAISDIPGRDCVVAIGPEGDFSNREIEDALAGGFTPLDLGDMRLRTETAGLLSCAAIALKAH